MMFFRPREADCTEAVAQELFRIPSLFGRLAHVAACHDPGTGEYYDKKLSPVFGEAEAGRALRQAHKDLFLEWLCYPLERQIEDLGAYLADKAAVEWEMVMLARAGACERLMPDDALPVERELIALDLQIALDFTMARGARVPRTDVDTSA